MKHLGDITKIDGAQIEPVDCITFGSPCQDLSIAGRREGLAGERSSLFLEAVRIIKEMREATNGKYPAFAVWENVPGAFSSNKGEDFRTVLEELSKIRDPAAVIPRPPKGKWRTSGAIMGDGWSLAWRTHDAQFWGVPQRRRRISVVVDFGGDRASEILFDRRSLPGDPQESGATRQGTAAGVKRSAGIPSRALPGDHPGIGSGLESTQGSVTAFALRMRAGCEGGGKGALVQTEKSGTLGCVNDQTIFCSAFGFIANADKKAGSIGCRKELPPTLKTDGKSIGVLCLQGNLERGAKCNGTGISAETAYTLNTIDRHCVFENHSQDSRVTGPCSIALTVSAKWGTGGNNTPLVMATGQTRAEILENQAPTLSCSHEQPIACGIDCRNATENGDLSGTLQAHESGGFSLNCIHPVRIGRFVRRLTPLECERLQGYPDGWTDIGEWTDSKGKRHKESSDTARYTALGNSIALPFWFWLTKRIAKHLPAGAALGSLFDGIGGFPLCWETVHGKGTAIWASEKEEFPIAVTRKRIGKDDKE